MQLKKGDKVRYGMRTYTVRQVKARNVNGSNSDSLLIGPSRSGRNFLALSHECRKLN